MDELIEQLSVRVHEQWMQTKRDMGIGSRLAEDGEELMVPYEQLSEAQKNLDRNSVVAVLDAANELGYVLVPLTEVSQ